MTKEDFMEQWGVRGMPLDKQRLANAAWDDATKAMRDLCAKLCESSAASLKESINNDFWCGYADTGAAVCANTIRTL